MRSLKLACVAALAAAAVVVAAPRPGVAGDADFKLVNRTGYQIDEVYVSAHSSHHWGHDIMGRDALADGEVVKITFPHGGDACHYDIKVLYHDDDSTAEWSDINLCKYERISLYWDEKKQVTRAVGD